MRNRIPPGTRDVLPDEMRELRRLERALADVFERYGYGEVATPAIEYDEVLRRGESHGAQAAFRFFDDAGDLLERAGMRGGPEVVEQARRLGGQAVERATRRMTATFDALGGRGVAERVRLDLGLLRDLGYYTGAILEVYDPALGHILGGGGRYDELMGRFGRPLPAAGFALYLERVHIAQAEEERLGVESWGWRRPPGP